MWYVLISIFTTLLGIFLICLTAEATTDKWVVLCSIFGAFLTIYGIISFLALASHNNLDYDLEEYEKAKTEMRFLQNEEDIPIHLAVEYKGHIEEVNRLIDKSAKYHDNWYMNQFYYKEIGELEKIKTDSIKTKRVQIFSETFQQK